MKALDAVALGAKIMIEHLKPFMHLDEKVRTHDYERRS